MVVLSSSILMLNNSTVLKVLTTLMTMQNVVYNVFILIYISVINCNCITSYGCNTL